MTFPYKAVRLGQEDLPPDSASGKGLRLPVLLLYSANRSPLKVFPYSQLPELLRQILLRLRP